MAEVDETMEKPNGVTVNPVGDDEGCNKSKQIRIQEEHVTLYAVFRRLITEIFFPNPNTSYESTTLLHRIKTSVSENFPLLPEASRNSGRDVLLWTRRGSPLRALLVVSVGTVTLLASTGILVFMLLFLVATVNAIVISLLVSLAVVGGFLALFFACVTAIYIGALSIAAFFVSTATISAIIAALVVTGWIGFFYSIWLLMWKSVDLAKHSLSMTGSALSAYSFSRHAQSRREPGKISD